MESYNAPEGGMFTIHYIERGFAVAQHLVSAPRALKGFFESEMAFIFECENEPSLGAMLEMCPALVGELE